MAQVSKFICSKCNNSIASDPVKTGPNEYFHEECFICDECSQSMKNKRVAILADKSGKERRVCEPCAINLSELSINSVNNNKPPPIIPANDKMICKECNKLIIGVSIKTPDQDYYHKECYNCENCKKNLQGLKYGYVENNKKKQRWCSSCIEQQNKINQSTGNLGYMSELKKYKGSDAVKTVLNNKNNTISNDNSNIINQPVGKDRICVKCNNPIKGPGIQCPDNRIYHKYCLDCDECKKFLQPKDIKFKDDKKLCNSCSAKYAS